MERLNSYLSDEQIQIIKDLLLSKKELILNKDRDEQSVFAVS